MKGQAAEVFDVDNYVICDDESRTGPIRCNSPASASTPPWPTRRTGLGGQRHRDITQGRGVQLPSQAPRPVEGGGQGAKQCPLNDVLNSRTLIISVVSVLVLSLIHI